MKKIGLYIMLAFVMAGVVSCDEDFNKDVADPQSWEQEAAGNITFTASAVPAIDLAAVTDERVTICAFSAPDVEGESSITYKAMLGGTVLVDVDAQGQVAKEDLQEAIVALYGRRPNERTVAMVVIAYVAVGDKSFRVSAGSVDLIVTPEAPVIESAYYVVGDVAGGWSKTNFVMFSHSGKDVYEDPVFVLTLNNPQDKANFKIIPKSGEAMDDFWPSAMGTATDQDDSLEGTILPGNPGAIQVAEKGWVRITLDMMAYTYKIEPLGEMVLSLYVPGGYQNWNPSTAPIVYCQNYDFKYDGYINVDGNSWEQGFKFVTGPDWPNGENGFKDYGTDSTGDPGNLTGSGNINVAETGFYRLTVDLSGSYAYTATKTQWGIIGDATPGGWDSSTPMTLNAATNEWEIGNVTLNVGGFKFRANDGWAINLGGDMNNLTYDGGNISVAEAGTYSITLQLGDPKAYKVTLVKL